MGQILFNALLNGAIIAPPAIAFTMLFAILRFPNFAVGAFITVGAYAALVFNLHFGLGIVGATLAGMLATALLFWLSDLVVFRPMRDHSEVALLVASIALTFVVESVIRFFFGSGVRGFDLPLSRPLEWAGVRATPDQFYLVLAAALAMVGTDAVLRFTLLGKAMRATADNRALAEVRGIDTERVTIAVLLFGGALVGLSGVLAGIDLVIEPLLGWKLIIAVLAAAILGGIGSPFGAMAGALLVGLAEELTVLILPSTYKVGVGFIIVAAALLVRPQGLFGRPEIKK